MSTQISQSEKKKPIPYGRQAVSEADIEAVISVLKADFWTQGPKIKEFEDAFAEYVGSQYAVAVANGTAALHLCALALGVDKGQKVITSPITFAASSNCILYAGGDIEFEDIDPETVLLDVDAVRRRLQQSPRGTYAGLIPVDFAGYPVDMNAFRELADEYGLWIIEDACHAPGGAYTDKNGIVHRCGDGSLADLAIFSFHPVKHIAAGEGGMITTNNPELYQKLMVLRTHGITKNPDVLLQQPGGWYYEMHDLGYNYRLTDIQAALGKSQLDRADKGLARRREIASVYDKAFEGSKVKTIVPPAEVGHAYHLYVIQVEDRKGLYDSLRSQQIYAQVHYIPVHQQPFYQKMYPGQVALPNAEKYYDHCLSLPMYPALTQEEQEFVIDQVLSFCS